MQHGHKVRVCVSVVHLLADEVKNLGGALSVYMYLEKEEKHVLKKIRRAPDRAAVPFSAHRFKAVGQGQLILVPQHLEIV